MKVSVIGASVSGLFTAYLLAKKGVEVEVYERENVLGWPPRTLVVTSKISEILDFIPEEAILNKVRYIELYSRSRSARLELGDPDLVLERGKLLNLLAHLAEKAGAKIVFKHQFEGFAQFGKKIVVQLRNLDTGEEQRKVSDILIGADGALSAVSRAASCNGHSLVSLIQAKVRIPKGTSKETTQVWFDSNLTKYFCWLIPESEKIAVAGLIAKESKQAKAALNTFLEERELGPLEFQTAETTIHHLEFFRNRRISGNNIFFVGDAGAQVKLSTIGGVVPGLHGARALAHAIVNGQDYSRSLRELNRELNLHLLVRHVINRFNDEDYDDLLGMLDGELKEVLQEQTRDELTYSFLRLLLAEPRLITLGVKALLKSLL